MAKKAVPGFVRKIREECVSIDDAVVRILEQNKITKPPINVIQIAISMGFKVFAVEFADRNIVGAIADFKTPIKQLDNEKRVIAIDKNSYATRKIFTIAHEIGHFVMHCGENNDFFERDVYDDRKIDMRTQIEKDADKFAACLLLPKEMFKDFVANSPYYKMRSKENLIREICMKFLVSYKTAAMRLKEVGMDF